MNSQAIDRARDLGHLVSPPTATGDHEHWLMIARCEQRPFVALMVQSCWVRGRMVAEIRVIYEVGHLPLDIAGQAHLLVERAAAGHPTAVISFDGPSCGEVAQLPMEGAERLASDLTALGAAA